MTHHKKQDHHNRPYKIAAQTAGLVASIFILFYFVGKGVPEILKNDENELVPFLPFLIIPFSGFIIAWYKEFTGALIMTAGGVTLLFFLVIKGDVTTGLAYGLPFMIAGILFLVHISKRNKLKRKSPPAPKGSPPAPRRGVPGP